MKKFQKIKNWLIYLILLLKIINQKKKNKLKLSKNYLNFLGMKKVEVL